MPAYLIFIFSKLSIKNHLSVERNLTRSESSRTIMMNAMFMNHECHERRRHEQWRLQIHNINLFIHITSPNTVQTPKKVINKLHALRKGSSLLAKSLTSFDHVDTIAGSVPVARSSSESDSCLPDGLARRTRGKILAGSL